MKPIRIIFAVACLLSVIFGSMMAEGAYALERQQNVNAQGNTVTPVTPAASTAGSTSGGGGSSAGGGTMGGGATTVTVTEKVPGADCSGGGGVTNRRYKCTVGKGFGSVMGLLSGMVKYGTFLVVLIGILMIVASGVQISMGGIDSGMREDAKTRITNVLMGLAFLFLVSMILNTVAPWVYR